MHFHVQLIDDPAHPERRAQHREAHWAYFDSHKDHFVARGATLTDDMETYLSSVIFVEFDGWSSGYANDSATYGRIRKWQGLLLSGSPATVDFVSANLKPKRKGLLGKLASLVGS
ncbi:MAG: hypothetical protein HOD62_09890 [Chloroflexi bacterium]|nr:hypothetical protein [Chloroflexota bacterium]